MNREGEASSSWQRAEVRLPTPDGDLAAWWYTPGAPAPWPCVVMAHGFCGTRELRLDAYAERFAAAGLAVLVFDYRHFGGSDGKPRQLLDLQRQLEDWRSALTHVRFRRDVDAGRIAIWGTSLGGGHVLSLATQGEKVAAVVAQVPHVDGFAAVRRVSPIIALRLTIAGLRDAVHGLLGREPLRVPVVGRPGELAAMTTPDTLSGFRAMLPPGKEPGPLELSVCARVFLRMPSYRPGRQVDRIRCPVLVQIARDDTVAPASVTECAVRRIPRGEVEVLPVGHFDVYVGEWFETVVTRQLAFLRNHLGLEETT